LLAELPQFCDVHLCSHLVFNFVRLSSCFVRFQDIQGCHSASFAIPPVSTLRLV